MNFDRKEQRIINESRIGGALIGGTLGAIIGNNSKLGTERGAVLGAGLGFLGGNQVGKQRAGKARSLRLENDQLSLAVSELRRNNDRLADYNRKVALRIAELRRESAGKRAALAKAELRAIDKTIKDSKEYTEEASKAKDQLVSNQASTYESNLRPYVQKQNQLVSYRKEVAEMSLASAE